MGDLVLVRTCPNCQWSGAASTYDIGSGPEWSCPGCEMCYGASGQDLNPEDPFRIPRSLYEQLPEWSRANPRWIVIDG